MDKFVKIFYYRVYYLAGKLAHFAEKVNGEVKNLAKPIEIFYSYSHKDEEFRQELEKQLSILRRNNVITAWHDRMIGAGEEWSGQIDEHLNSARIILLLISADFISSDYCYDIEMTRAMERHEAKEACVIPIILRPCKWELAKFAKLQAFPKNAKAVTLWENKDEAFLNIVEGIELAINKIENPQ